jgi:hypothetical protein
VSAVCLSLKQAICSAVTRPDGAEPAGLLPLVRAEQRVITGWDGPPWPLVVSPGRRSNPSGRTLASVWILERRRASVCAVPSTHAFGRARLRRTRRDRRAGEFMRGSLDGSGKAQHCSGVVYVFVPPAILSELRRRCCNSTLRMQIFQALFLWPSTACALSDDRNGHSHHSNTRRGAV